MGKKIQGSKKSEYNMVMAETVELPAGCLLTDHELDMIKNGKSMAIHEVPKTKRVTTYNKHVYWSFGLRFTTETI